MAQMNRIYDIMFIRMPVLVSLNRFSEISAKPSADN